MELMCQGDLECAFEQDQRLTHPVHAHREHRLAVEGLHEGLRQIENLREHERPLEIRSRPLVVAGEDQEAAELSGDLGQHRVGLVGFELRDHGFQPRDGLRRMAGLEIEIRQNGDRTCRGPFVSELGERGMRLLEQRPRLARFRGAVRHLARPRDRAARGPRRRRRVVRPARSSAAPRPLRRATPRARRPARALARPRLTRRRRRRRAQLVGSEVVGCEHLDELVVAASDARDRSAAARWRALRSRRRERLVGDVANRSCRKPYWPCSGERGSAWIASTSLRTSDGEQRLEVRLRRPESAASAARVNVLPSTAPSCTSRRSSSARPSSRAAISACSVSGTSRASTAPTRPVDGAVLRTSAPRSSSMRTVSTA